MMTKTGDINSLILIDKPSNMTSHDVIRSLRKHTGQRSFGHAGTLDPLATGMLPILCGTYTRYAKYLQSKSKQYHVVIQLGRATTTDDRDGEVIASDDKLLNNTALCEQQIKTCLQSFVGIQVQKRPAHTTNSPKRDHCALYSASICLRTHQASVLLHHLLFRHLYAWYCTRFR